MHAEGTAVVADAFLGVEDGSGGGGFDDDGGDEIDGGEQGHGEERQGDVGDALDGVLPLGHEAVVDDDEGGVEDGVLLDGTDDEVACVGSDFDDEVGAGVECAEQFGCELLLVVLEGDDDLLDAVLLDDVAELVGGAEAGHHFRQLGVGSCGLGVETDVAHEEVAGVGLLVFEVEVGVEGFGAAANHECGESDLSGVDAAHRLGGDQEAEEVGEGELHGEEEEERAVVLAVGARLVVDEQEEEDCHYADDGGEEGVEQFLEARLAQHIAVGAHDGVEREPSEGHDDEAEPEVVVTEEVGGVVEVGVFEVNLPEEEEQAPRQHGAEGVEEYVFDCLFAFHEVWVIRTSWWCS